MKRGHAVVVPLAIGVGVLAGWAIGRVHNDCEHTCPAQGSCPTPASCLAHSFNWLAALALGIVACLIVGGLGFYALRRHDA